jgi:hypothetical protein
MTRLIRPLLLATTASLALGLTACGGDCVDESYLDITVSDSVGPVLATLTWEHDNGESGTVDCPGACEVQPSEPGTVTLTATPTDTALSPVTEEVSFNQAVAEGKECPEAVVNKVDLTVEG